MKDQNYATFMMDNTYKKQAIICKDTNYQEDYSASDALSQSNNAKLP